MLPNDNVSMFVGHLYQVFLTVYSSMEHVWSRATSSCKQSRRDQDVRRTSKRCR